MKNKCQDVKLIICARNAGHNESKELKNCRTQSFKLYNPKIRAISRKIKITIRHIILDFEHACLQNVLIVHQQAFNVPEIDMI